MPVLGRGGDRLYLGRGLQDVSEGDLFVAVSDAMSARFDFVSFPLGRSTIRKDQGQEIDAGKEHQDNHGGDELAAIEAETQSISTRFGAKGDETVLTFAPSISSDLVMEGSMWSSSVVGVCSTHLDPENGVADVKALETEMSFGCHLGLFALQLPPPNPQGCARYAAMLNRYLLSRETAGVPLVVRVPLRYTVSKMPKEGQKENDEIVSVDGWSVWNQFRSLIEEAEQLAVCLVVDAGSPAGLGGSDVELDRWYAENVHSIELAPSAFTNNAKDYPVLSRRLQSFLGGFFPRKTRIILKDDELEMSTDSSFTRSTSRDIPERKVCGQSQDGCSPASTKSSEGETISPEKAKEGSPARVVGVVDGEVLNNGSLVLPSAHQRQDMCRQYLGGLYQRRCPPDVKQRFQKAYLDFLQAPLQPLHHHLESQTYETFEEDPVKYVLYEDAIKACIWDKLAAVALVPDFATHEAEGVVEKMKATVEEQEGGSCSSSSCSVKIADPNEAGECVSGPSTTGTSSLTAIQSRIALQDFSQAFPSDDPLVLMVVGAGRGPLVQACLNSVEFFQNKIFSSTATGDEASSSKAPNFRVYAVEKNPNAVLTLRHRNRSEWANAVELIGPMDMRNWQTDARADVMVSELLGSFSDNELSPECLDGAQRFLRGCTEHGINEPSYYSTDNTKTSDAETTLSQVSMMTRRRKNLIGTSIPQRYISTLQLISSPKLWQGLRKSTSKLEQGYVVAFQEVFPISSSEHCLEYVHPNPRIFDGHNDRYCEITLKAEADSLCHGFAAYFHSDLYVSESGETRVEMSIDPVTETDELISWFPMFFPLKQPLSLRSGEEVKVALWRLSDARRVWYEWAVLSPLCAGGGVHNPGGRSYSIYK
ncbi:unnamed protein product [Amoebophrya sp. A25]|nr:unnamed protein product [Amoebophrya sp. A25]|eukprot:GSA25T00020078001.1